jgi:flagellar hook assembly protein FlgD
MGHGTFVAGVAAAATNNGVGVAGAGYNTSLLAIKAADDTGAFTVDSVAAGIIWAADNGANVINISLSGPTTSSIEQNAVAYAQSKGVLVVAAAGNDASTTPVYPAGDPGVIAVGATDAAGQRATFSNYGSWVTVGAPGVGIFSTTPPAGSSIFPAADYGSGDGTSFSSPLVAGEAALLKAQDPAASTADVRRALVASAHGYSGLGLGTGQVDFSAAFSHLSPNTAPTVGISGDSGIVSISATSTAPAVEFQIDGGAYSGPVLVSSGVATYSWTSWGVANGPHTVHAIDCTQYGECGTSSSAANMVLTNATPGVTSPAAGAAVSGGFTITASSPGGGLQFRIDNVRRGFDATSPYSLAYTGSALTEGTHTVQVLQCSSDETSCAGPASPAVSFTARSLHPTITALTPNPFSPNRDGLKDTARVTIHLPDSESVAVSVLNASAATVRGPLGLHTLTAGTHYWTWSGITNGGVRAANGTYTVQVSTSRTINGVTVWGLVTHSVRLDTVAPGFSALTGAGAGFYPYPDGYHDTFSPGVALSEAGVLTFTIRTSAGRTVRVLRLSKPKGRVSLTWNGRDSANHLVAAGTYRWSYSVVDAASNTRRTSTYSVTVSSRRLVAKSAVVTKKGSQYRFWGGDPTYCTGASLTDSDFYPNGIWLENVCDPGFDGPAVAAAYYDFTMPAAISYQTLTMQVYGNTISDPSEILAGFTRPNSPTVDIPAYVGVSPTSNTWYSLGHVAAGGHYNSARTTEIAVAVDDYYGAPSDFDIGYVRLTVRYTVLQ